ncbi:MAG: shikimate dehydrogenase family protein [Bilophila wadsworthia]
MSTFTPPALHGIIGYPLGHSMSPLMHNTAFRTLNLPGVYLSWPIEPGRLPAFVDAARLLNIRGCSITIPHKIDIIPLLDKTSENVREMGACNTLYRDGEKICGENTDVIGFTAPLRKRSLSPETRVLVLGAGGVSRAAIAGLRRLGLANITLTNRRKERAEALCNEFGLLCAPWEERGDVPADLIINTTPLGMTGAQEHETPYPRAFQDNGIAYDLIYTPFQTRFCATPRLRAGKPSQASICSSGRGRPIPPVDGAPSSGRSHNGGDFRALWAIKTPHTSISP